MKYSTNARSIPKEINCTRCHQPAAVTMYPASLNLFSDKDIAEETEESLPEVEESTTGRDSHLEALHERRSQADIDRILEEALTRLRSRADYDVQLRSLEKIL